MAIQTVGVLMPGDMGHTIGQALREGGISDLADDATLVREADLVLAIVVPAQARTVAARLAAACRATGADLLYADCNAIAPQTTRAIADLLTAAGVRYVDASIIGRPPRSGAPGPRLYVSGPDAPALVHLGDHGLDVRVVGPEIGQASGLKMCYAAVTKGLAALATEALTAGRALGLEAVLAAELQASQGALLAWITQALPGMPPKAARWVGEMEEIAATFATMGLPPEMLEGAAALYRRVSATPPGREMPEERRTDHTAEAVVADVLRVLQQR